MAILAQVPPPKWLFQKTLFSADSTPSTMECETGSFDTFSLVDAASSTGDDFLMMLDTPKSNSAQPADPADSLPMDPMLGETDVNMTKEDLHAQLQELQNTVSRLGLNTGVCQGYIVWFPGHAQYPREGLAQLGPPPLPESAARCARAVTHSELKSLLTEFGSNSWTASLVARILEIYVITKQSEEYDAFLKVKHTSKKGGSRGYLKENDPGSLASPLICAGCNAPWGGLEKSASSCKSTGTVDLSITPLSVIEVDGQVWQLRFSDSGPAWVLSDPKGSKVPSGTWVTEP